MGVDIVRIKNYGYDKYFSIYAWRKSGGSCDAKVKVIYHKKVSKVTLLYKLLLTCVFI